MWASKFPARSIGRRRFRPSQSYANGEKGWFFDLTDSSNLYQDAAGTTPVTTTGDPIGKVLDISGNANHATQPNGSTQRPTFRGTYAELDGSNDSLVTPAVNMTGTDTMTLVLGMRNAAGVTAVFVESSADGSANNGAIFDGFLTAAAAMFSKGAAGLVNVSLSSTIGLITNRDVVKRVKYTTQGTTAAQQVVPAINGTARALTVTGTADLTGNFGNHVWNIGRRNNASLPMTGRLYCAGLIGRALTANEEQLWGEYIAARMPRDVAISCVGNSLTAGSSLPSPATQAWPVVLQTALGGLARCDNWGHGGFQTPALTALLPTEGLVSADCYRPSCIVLWEALNHMAPAVGNVSPAVAYAAYLSFLADVRAGGFNGPVIAVCTGKASSVPDATTAAFTALLNANGVNDGFARVVDYTADPLLQVPLIDGIHLDPTQTALVSSGYIEPAVRAVLGM